MWLSNLLRTKPTAVGSCIRQLESLRQHCASMESSDDTDDIWGEDVKALKFAIDFLQKGHSVDSKKHGRWIAQMDYPGTYSICSCCEQRARGYVPAMAYCPNCGAKMDKGAE